MSIQSKQKTGRVQYPALRSLVCVIVAAAQLFFIHSSRSEEFEKGSAAYTWKWDDRLTDPKFLAQECPPGSTVNIRASEDPHMLFFAVAAINGKLIEWFDHDRSVFQIAGGKLFRVEFDPIDTGGAVVAADLRDAHQLWKMPLVAVGSVPHSGYSNRVNLRVEQGEVVVYGAESAGCYIEAKDAATGQTKVNTQFWANIQDRARPVSRTARRPLPPNPPDAPRLDWKWDDASADKPIVESARRISVGYGDNPAHDEVIATDLATQTEVWRSRLHGLGIVPKPKNEMRVSLRIEGEVLVICGRDERGRFIEEKEVKTGRNLVNTQYWTLPDTKQKPAAKSP